MRTRVRLHAVLLVVAVACSTVVVLVPGVAHAKATGKPVKVMVILDESEALGLKFDTARAGVKARVRQINGGDGLGGSGRPVEVVYCVTENDPNEAAACAREAADDDQFVAVAASVTGSGDAVNPILAEAGVPNVGMLAASTSDGMSEIAFPVMGGLVAAVGCQATVLADEAGAKKIGVAYADLTTGELAAALADQTLKARGLSVVNKAVVPVAKADVSAEVATVADGTDGIVTAMDGETAKKVIRTARQQGLDVPIAGSGAQQFTPAAIDALGDAVDGLYLALWFAPDDARGPGIKQYLKAMKKAKVSDQSDDLAKNSWIGLGLLDLAAKDLTTIDRTTLLDSLGQVSAYDTGGFTPVLDYTTPGTFLGGAQPRVVNTSCVYGQIDDGEIVSARKGFVNPFDVPGA